MTPERIVEIVSEKFGISVQEMTSPTKKWVACDARAIACDLIRYRFKFSLDSIGAIFSDRDHTTVLNALRRCVRRNEEDMVFRSIYSDLVALIPMADVEFLSVRKQEIPFKTGRAA